MSIIQVIGHLNSEYPRCIQRTAVNLWSFNCQNEQHDYYLMSMNVTLPDDFSE